MEVFSATICKAVGEKDMGSVLSCYETASAARG
jgi:hypothetical protein